MTILKPTAFTGRITFLGRVLAPLVLLHSEPCTELTATFAGIEGELHNGVTAPSCVRVTAQYPKGTTVANTRQISVLSQ